MNCTHPSYAINLGLKDDGKMRIKFVGTNDTFSGLEVRYGQGNVIPIRCGKCLACKVNYSRDWSVRCMLEASCYSDNYFLTLTYDDVNLPLDHKIVKSDIQDFIKNLRYYIPGLRYFACGEYGSTTKRPHYHLILFNCDIPDLVGLGKVRGNWYFDSDLIRKVWKKGHITIGDVTPTSCEYVARYCMKKINGDEFLLMSRKPGIGAAYFYDHFEDIYKTDGVYVEGRKYPVPRYFDKLFEMISPSQFFYVKFIRADNNKYSRISNLLAHGGISDEDAYLYQARCDIDKYKNKLKGVL